MKFMEIRWNIFPSGKKHSRQKEIIKQLGGEGFDLLGLEDPDIWIDEKSGLMHLYFTMPFTSRTGGKWIVHLGHAVGKGLDSLEMTMPVLEGKVHGAAKEVSIAPRKQTGISL